MYPYSPYGQANQPSLAISQQYIPNTHTTIAILIPLIHTTQQVHNPNHSTPKLLGLHIHALLYPSPSPISLETISGGAWSYLPCPGVPFATFPSLPKPGIICCTEMGAEKVDLLGAAGLKYGSWVVGLSYTCGRG